MEKKKTIVGVIPARYASTRFPGKPLVLIKDKPMVQWVYEAVREAFDYLIVATDDQRIKDAVEKFGGKSLMTSPEHQSGTDRCNEVLEILEKESGIKADIVVNIQGDEPLINKEQIIELLDCFKFENTEIATLVSPLKNKAQLSNPNVVKVVVKRDMEAMYFSRLAIPYIKNESSGNPDIHLKHIGLYAYKRSVLSEICDLKPSKLEIAESLEQLRWLENGYIIKAQLTDYENLGIDTPEDLENLITIINNTL